MAPPQGCVAPHAQQPLTTATNTQNVRWLVDVPVSRRQHDAAIGTSQCRYKSVNFLCSCVWCFKSKRTNRPRIELLINIGIIAAFHKVLMVINNSGILTLRLALLAFRPSCTPVKRSTRGDQPGTGVSASWFWPSPPSSCGRVEALLVLLVVVQRRGWGSRGGRCNDRLGVGFPREVGHRRTRLSQNVCPSLCVTCCVFLGAQGMVGARRARVFLVDVTSRSPSRRATYPENDRIVSPPPPPKGGDIYCLRPSRKKTFPILCAVVVVGCSREAWMPEVCHMPSFFPEPTGLTEPLAVVRLIHYC